MVIFPYRTVSGGSGVELILSGVFAKQFPNTWKYLKECEPELRARENDRMDHDGWYGYGRTQNLDLFGIPRIIVRDIIEHASFALDITGEFAFVSGYGITLKNEYAEYLAYVLGLLNSRLLDDYLKSVSTTLRGGWFRPFPQFLKQLPIKLPETAAERKLADQISERVRQIIKTKQRLQPGGLGDHERERLERETEAHEDRINQLVCQLYGVDEIPAD